MAGLDKASDERLEVRIRARAHRIWLQQGGPEGREDDYYDEARMLIAIEDDPSAGTEPVDAPENREGPWGEPVEPIEAVANQGEFPTLTDQGEEAADPRPRGTASR